MGENSSYSIFLQLFPVNLSHGKSEKYNLQLYIIVLFDKESYCNDVKIFADVFASLFEDSDLVASDLAAALVLLRLKRKYEEQREESFRKTNLHLPISRSSTASIGKLVRRVEFATFHQGWS